jgi:hypothetical protein
MRGWICRLKLLLVLASAVILGSNSRWTHDRILLSQIRDSPNLEGHVPVFISLRNRADQLYLQALRFFVVSYDSQRYGGGIRTRLHAGTERDKFIQVIYKSSVCTSQETHHVSATKSNRLMLFRETVAVYSENHTKHINTLCGQNAGLLVLKQVVHRAITTTYA